MSLCSKCSGPLNWCQKCGKPIRQSLVVDEAMIERAAAMISHLCWTGWRTRHTPKRVAERVLRAALEVSDE